MITTTTYTPIDEDRAKSLLGEGIHTGLRKAVESPASNQAWRAIRDMPEGEWDAVLAFALDGLNYMGYQVCRKEEADA